MKKTISALCVLMALLVGTSCLAAPQVTAKSGMHFDWWQGDNDDTGLQLIVPVQVSSTEESFTMDLIGAYVYTQVDPDAGERQSLSQLADTKLNISYGLSDRLPFDLLFGLGISLPTGHTDLSRSEMVLIQPPDLFTLPFFGEGLVVNPTIAAAKEWGSWVAGVGIGYTWREEYDYNYYYQDYDPGDIITATAEVRHAFSEDLTGKLYGQYIWYGKDQLDGDDYYDEGDCQLVGLGLTWKRTSWDLACNLSAIFRDKNEVTEGNAMPLESDNSHGDEFNASFIHQYHLNGTTNLRTSLAVLYIDANDYPSTSAYYVGKREKLTLGCGVDKALTNGYRLFAGIDGFMMEDDENWYHPDEDVTYTGFSLSAQVGKSF